MRNLITIPNDRKEAEYGKILLSDVKVTRKRSVFLGHKWRTVDIQIGVWILSIHLLALFAPFTFTWSAFWAAFCGNILCTMCGITICYHRTLSHHSLKLPKWLEYTFAYFGVLSGQRDPISWVSYHRYHHQYVDSEKDVHSPIFGFWYSHIGWLFDSAYLLEKYHERNNVEDLKKQKFYRFLKRTYVMHIVGFAALVYAIGGFTYLVWVVGVNIAWGYHAIFLVNSACHIWGNQAWNTGDLSKNNWWVALVTFGEGWHNNHHAFEFSARHGLEWWQIDFSWYMIWFLKALGLATNVKLLSDAHKLKKSFATHNKFK